MKKGTSAVPLVMGIIGGVLSMASGICSGACMTGLGSLAMDPNAASYGGTIMGFGIFGGLLGIIGGIMGKPLPMPAGIIMLISFILVIIMFIFNVTNILGIICAIILLIGAAFCFAQKKIEATPKETSTS
jgi:hypothetical protein